MESMWEAESYPALQDYYLVCYFAFAFPVARFLLNCLFYQVGTLLLLQMGFSLSLSLSLSHEQALATMRVVLKSRTTALNLILSLCSGLLQFPICIAPVPIFLIFFLGVTITTQEGFIDKHVEMMIDKQNPFSWGFCVCVSVCVSVCESRNLQGC